MSVANIRFFSDALGKWTRYNVILPDAGEGPFPVLFQLHGLTDDCDAWLERSNLVRHAANYPFVIVMPDGGTSCYLNWKSTSRLGKAAYEDLIITDISNHVRRHFNVTDGPWAIGGLSMGGYGSLHFGLKYPERFASIWAHSSKIDWRQSELDLSQLADPETVDLVPLAEQVNGLDHKPVLSFDCGVDDYLIDENRAFHAALDAMDFEHHYAEHPGEHEWDYWDLHVQEALAQHARVLGVVEVSPR
jgi:putative tributyrin esterase